VGKVESIVVGCEQPECTTTKIVCTDSWWSTGENILVIRRCGCFVDLFVSMYLFCSSIK
jgi:hypothetical protein